MQVRGGAGHGFDFELSEPVMQPAPSTGYKIKTGTSQGEITCRLCGGAAESLAHVLTGCPVLAQVLGATQRCT